MKILSMPAAAGASKLEVYNEGVWGIAYDNPGSWVADFTIASGATLNPTSMTLTASASGGALIGSANPIDLTDYSLLKITIQVTGAPFAFGICDSKDARPAHRLAVNTLPVNTGLTEYVVDVSSLTTGYLVLFVGAGAGRTGTVTKITLE